MRAAVSKDGVLIPKSMLKKGVTKVDIQREGGSLVVRPVSVAQDAVWKLGTRPVHTGVADSADNHDEYLYGKK